MPVWPHAPVHWLFEPGIYIVTAATLGKQHLFAEPARRDLLLTMLFEVAGEFHWSLEAWAMLSNHYHFIARSPSEPESLRRLLRKLHANSGREINRLDGISGRKVWFQFWDERITYERSYLARLHYVHHNPARHGVVRDSTSYPWCSAAWFAGSASPAFRATVESFKTDRVNVPDDF